MEFPSGEWREKLPGADAGAMDSAPFAADWRRLPGAVRHTFTHFSLELTVWAGAADAAGDINGLWCRAEQFGDYALPSVMKKVARHALKYS